MWRLKNNDKDRNTGFLAVVHIEFSKFVRLSTCPCLRSLFPDLNKPSHWPLALTGIPSHLSPVCWCRSADAIGCSPPVLTDSRRWDWKYLLLLLLPLWMLFVFSFLLLLPHWSLLTAGVRFSDPCAVRGGDDEKLHSLQKSWNHIKQIEKLKPPRDQFNYINVPDFSKFCLTSALPHLPLFSCLFAC